MKEKPKLSVQMTGKKQYTTKQKKPKSFAVLTGHGNTAQARSEICGG